MTSLERWSLHLAALFTGLTGLLYGWLNSTCSRRAPALEVQMIAPRHAIHGTESTFASIASSRKSPVEQSLAMDDGVELGAIPPLFVVLRIATSDT